MMHLFAPTAARSSQKPPRSKEKSAAAQRAAAVYIKRLTEIEADRMLPLFHRRMEAKQFLDTMHLPGKPFRPWILTMLRGHRQSA
nr:MAG TPA: hypothetical protein [Caudoviricetes sp.]